MEGERAEVPLLPPPGLRVRWPGLHRTLRRKVEEKHSRFPDRIDIDGLDRIRTFSEFDDRYTAPLHGFDSARHYWRESGCLRFLEHIDVPFLLINASDDPFRAAGCSYPRAALRKRMRP